MSNWRQMMNSLRHAFREIWNHLIASALTVGVFMLVAVSAFIFMSLIYISRQIDSVIKKEYPLTVAVSCSDGEITNTEIAQILQMKHVVGCEAPCKYMALPVGFENYVSTHAVPAKEVQVYGDYNCAWTSVFYSGQAELVEGSMPKSNECGVLIDRDVAEYNRISVGDTLSISIKGKVEEYDVKGIYVLNYPLRQLSDSATEVEYTISPYSAVFINNVALQLNGVVDSTYHFVRFFVDENKNRLSVISEIRNQYPAFDAINGDDLFEAQMRSSIDAANQITQLLAATLGIVGYIVLIIISIYTAYVDVQRERTLFILGYSRWNRDKRFLIKTLLFLIPAVGISWILLILFQDEMLQVWLNYLFYQDPDAMVQMDFNEIHRIILTKVNMIPMWHTTILAFLILIILLATVYVCYRKHINRGQYGKK